MWPWTIYIYPGFNSAGEVQTTSKSPDGVRETFRRFPLTHSRPTVVSWTTSSKERESKKVAFRTATKCGGWFQWCRSRRRLKGSLRPCSPCSLRCAWLRAALDSDVYGGSLPALKRLLMTEMRSRKPRISSPNYRCCCVHTVYIAHNGRKPGASISSNYMKFNEEIDGRHWI